MNWYAKSKHKYSGKWEEVESLMLLYIISYNIMRQFMKWLREKKEWKIVGKERGKYFMHFVMKVGMLSGEKQKEDTS